jgi:hypothetical protein
LTPASSHHSIDAMTEKKDEKTEIALDKEGLGTISRREFTIGSIALIGAYSANESLAQAADQIKLEISDDVRHMLEERHILDEDLIQVIQNAEKTGEKLYEPETGRFLSKLHIKNVYFYAEYSIAESKYRIHAAYSHRFSID